MPARHVIGIDDAPLEKFTDAAVLIVGAVLAGPHLLEGVLTTRLPIDGPDAAAALARWLNRSRFHPLLRAILLDGISIAGLSIIDLPLLHQLTGKPVIAATRRQPDNRKIIAALRTAGFPDRIAIVERNGPAAACGRIHFTCAGIDADGARALIEEQTGRSRLPEAVRLAHLIASGVARGESHGRV